MKTLFISTRSTKPSYRFRIEQHLSTLQKCGHECSTVFASGSFWSRTRSFKQLDFHDVIILQKKLLSQTELNILKTKTAKLIYDIDDAIMFNSKGEKQSRRQRRFQATARIVDEIICGNEYLAEQARLHNRFVTLIPTAVNVKKMLQASKPYESTSTQENQTEGHSGQKKFTLGWTGSKSNACHLNHLFPMISELGSQFHLKIISDSAEHFQFEKLSPVSYEFISWTPENEFRELASFDVGLMPLPENRWTRGKCSFKALQYMALRIPTLCSPVGMNADLIQHGNNGFLASSDKEWKSILRDLHNSPETCKRIGQEGQKTVLNKYDTEIISLKLARIIEKPVYKNSRAA